MPIKKGQYYSSYKLQLLKHNLKRLNFTELANSISIEEGYIMNRIAESDLKRINEIGEEYDLCYDDVNFRPINPKTKKFMKKSGTNPQMRLSDNEKWIIEFIRRHNITIPSEIRSIDFNNENI